MPLTEMQSVQALERLAIIRPHFEDGVCQTEIARVHQISLRTVQRWVQAYREEGFTGLGTKARSDAGHCRGLPEELVLLVEGLAVQAVRRPLTSIHALVSQVADEQDWPRPSYAQVYRIVQQMPKDLVTLGREGAAAYREAFDLLYRREARCANAIWQADHCQLRCYFLNEQGKAQMPLLTAIEDDYSRSLAGYRLSWSAPSAVLTALTLRGAISVKEDPRWPIYGVPERFYTDHGSDFTSKHLEAVAADLKMALIFSQVGRPRGRGKMERLFLTVREEVLAKLPGYAPKVEGNMRRQREIEAEARKEACLTLDEFDEIFRTWVVETYATRIHTETHAAPHVRWLSSGVIPVLPRNEAQLDKLLVQPRRRRVVHQEGITLLGAWYMHELLAGHVKEAVIIRYDPMDLGTIRVYEGEKEERFLCQAFCVERGGQAVSVQEIVTERTKRRKAVGKALRERKRVVERYASPEQQAMRAMEKVPAAPGPEGRHEGGSVDEDESVTECVTECVTELSEQSKKQPKIRWYDDE
ncbi:DDE-type integrase/transposase/recombinase [Ktedonobacteria bacterium brp13]|nr:DDE-type integrase/transposase/recombinase [Ktedonobacteria bacterium brp13]